MDYLKKIKCSMKNKTYRKQFKVQRREGRREELIEGEASKGTKEKEEGKKG